MFKKRLKGLLAMVLAGSIATTTLPLSASATISSNFIYDGAAPSKTLQQLCAENSFEGTLCAVYATNTSDSNDVQLTATYGNDEIRTECTRIENLEDSYNVQMKDKHKYVVTTGNPDETDISATSVTEEFAFPKTIYLSNYNTGDPLKKFSSWTAWYNVNSASLAKEGTTTPIADGDTSISISPATIKGLYEADGFDKSDLFNNGVTIIKLNTDYKTFEIPVYNALVIPETDGSGNPIKYSITEGVYDSLNAGKEFYLFYGNEVQGDRVSTKDELWNKIVTLARNKRDSFNDEQLFLLRYAKVTVRSNGKDKGYFTSGDYYNFLRAGTPNDVIQKTFINANPQSIWKISGNNVSEKVYTLQGTLAQELGNFLLRNSDVTEIYLDEQTYVYVTGEVPSAYERIPEGSYFESPLLKNGSPATISNHAAKLTVSNPPASGKKYDTTGWQLWIGGKSGSSFQFDSQINVGTGVNRIDVEQIEAAEGADLIIYFPQVDAPSSGGGNGGSSSRPEPSYDPNKPTIDGEEKDWDDVAREIGKFSEGETKTITLGRDKTIPADVIKAIKDSKAVITFKINSAFSWTVDGSTLTDGDIHDYDFSIEVITATGVEILRGDVGVGFKIGDISDGATLNINFKIEHAQKFANLYKMVDGELVFVDNVKIDENGAAIGLEVTEAGEYVVMLGKMSDRPGDMDNDGIMNAKDSLAILKDFLGMESGANPLVSDMNGDSFINAKDALIIVKKSVGIE